MRNRSVVALLLTGLLGLALFVFGGPGLFESLTGSPTPAASPSAGPVPGVPVPGPAEVSGPAAVPANPSRLPAISESALPAEARRTLAMIRQGGPYPYSQDDQAFGNFERILPRKASGHYREYTVPTRGNWTVGPAGSLPAPGEKSTTPKTITTRSNSLQKAAEPPV